MLQRRVCQRSWSGLPRQYTMSTSGEFIRSRFRGMRIDRLFESLLLQYPAGMMPFLPRGHQRILSILESERQISKYRLPKQPSAWKPLPVCASLPCEQRKGLIRTSTIGAMGQLCVQLQVRSSIHEDQGVERGLVECHCKTRDDSEFGPVKREAVFGKLTR